MRDEHRIMQRRQNRRRHPVLGFVVVVAALGGIGFVGLAFQAGSFSAGGAIVDHQLADWRTDLLGPAARAGAKAGQAVQNAGQSITTQSQQLSPSGG